MNVTTEISKHTVTKPHYEPKLPYGYKFEGIDLIKPDNFCDALELFCELRNTHNTHMIQLGNNFPHVDRVIWEVAAHIERCYGLPYDAILVYSKEHDGMLMVFSPKTHEWWNDDIRSCLNQYLMGLRSLFDLVH